MQFLTRQTIATLFCIFVMQKFKVMELTIKIDQRKKEARALLEYLKNLPFVEVTTDKPRYNAETEKAIIEARKGNTEKISLNEFRNQLYS